MANTPGNAPPSVNQLDAFMQARSPSAEIGKFNQDPQAAAVMQWLATPEAQEFLRRIVMEQGLMGQGSPPGAPGPGSGGAPLPLPGGPPGMPSPGGPPGGPGPMGPGSRGGPPGPGHFRPHEQRPVPPPPTGPGMGPSPAPGVPGGDRDLSDPESFGPQGGHPLAGLGGAIAGAFGGPRPVFDPRTGQQLHVDPNTVRGAGRRSSGPGRAAAIQALIAEQAAGGRVGR
ncbi:hypothetical protein [uncultured Mediterranean phage uvDeep-CGR2-AD7-C12]|nr:hypothetical protein [uncultured Mediterranean phage uvDeep-CGR2-AD7-C12]